MTRVRPATTAADLLAIQSIASRRWPQGWHPGGLGWSIARWQLDEGRGAEIVVLGDPAEPGSVGAWATRGEHGEGEVSVQTDVGREDLLDPSLDWALDGLDGLTVRVEAYYGDDALAKALARRGFAPDAALPIRGMFRTTSGLTPMGSGWIGYPGSPPPRRDLSGYRVRAVVDGELDERVEVHRRAWKPASLPWADGREVDPDAESSFNRPAYDAVRAAWLYRQDLDLVAEAPDGTLAACCIVWFDPATGVAEIEPMGVDPEHRRHGLAVELCLEACRRVADLGGTEVFLNVNPSEEYPANAAAYAKAGFEVRRRGVHHVRPPLAT